MIFCINFEHLTYVDGRCSISVYARPAQSEESSVYIMTGSSVLTRSTYTVWPSWVSASMSGFLNLSTIHIWTRSFFVVGGCPVRGRMSSSLHGLYPLDVSSTIPQIVTIKTTYRQCQMSPGGGQNHAPPELRWPLKVWKTVFLIKASKGRDHLQNIQELSQHHLVSSFTHNKCPQGILTGPAYWNLKTQILKIRFKRLPEK